jgi:hypothetical protein
VIDGAALPDRAFLLREFAELIEPGPRADGSAQHARSEVAAAHVSRAKPSSSAARFVIADPVGRSASVMYATAVEIEALVQRIVWGLFGRHTPT